MRTLRIARKDPSPPHPQTCKPQTEMGQRTARVGTADGRNAPKDPGGMPRLSCRYPYRTPNKKDDRQTCRGHWRAGCVETCTPGSEGGRWKSVYAIVKEQCRITRQRPTLRVTVIAVPPHTTTQACSRCGALPAVSKTLADRVHSCLHCGYVADRDLNAARNILRLGSSLQDKTCADGRSVS